MCSFCVDATILLAKELHSHPDRVVSKLSTVAIVGLKSMRPTEEAEVGSCLLRFREGIDIRHRASQRQNKFSRNVVLGFLSFQEAVQFNGIGFEQSTLEGHKPNRG